MEPALFEQDNLIRLSPAEPLWQRVPTRDEQGRLLNDFMMLIPGLNRLPDKNQREIIHKLEKLLGLYHEFVVLADLNLKINILWISHRQRAGLGIELATAIYALIPEARLVAQRYD